MNKKTKDQKMKLKKPNPYLDERIIFEILKFVPPELLQSKIRYVCKSWFNMISTPLFIQQNFIHSKPHLIIQQQSYRSTFKSHILEINKLEDGFNFRHRHVPIRYDTPMICMGRIMPSCNGMLLVNNPKQRGILCVMNKTTKRIVSLPMCPTFCPHYRCGCALAFDPIANLFKVVHIYAAQVGFEILNLGGSNNNWRQVSGPFDDVYDGPVGWNFHRSDPILINGKILHWYVGSREFIVSMDVSDEKSRKTLLPQRNRCDPKLKYEDVLMEMNGFLSVMFYVKNTQIDLWVLKDFESGIWEKQHSIVTDSINFVGCHHAFPELCKLIPVISFGDGEVILFKNTDYGSHSGLFVYEIENRRIWKFRTKFKDRHSILVHANSLFSWENQGHLSESDHNPDDSQSCPLLC